MNITAIGIFSILGYLAATGFLIRETITEDTQKPSIYLGWFGASAHGIYTLTIIEQQSGLNFGFFDTASLVSMLVALLILFATFDKPVEKLGIAVFPMAAILLGLDMAFPHKTQTSPSYDWPMSIHILTSIAAFSLLNVAALQAVLLAIQDRQLRSHNPRRIIRSLPPLQAMESLLFQMIGAGLFFLTISLVSGILFIDDLFAQHLVHKTVLSIVAWVIFSGLLLGRIRYGWRGQIAIRWTLAGFILLLLAYFGSKLVLEIILQKR